MALLFLKRREDPFVFAELTLVCPPYLLTKHIVDTEQLHKTLNDIQKINLYKLQGSFFIVIV